MVLIFCNQCFDSKIETHQKFIITNCYHVFCEGCTKNATDKNYCIVCKKSCKILPINEELPSEVKNYFDQRSIERLLDNIEKISRFRDTQHKTYALKNAPYRKSFYEYKKYVSDLKDQIVKVDQAMLREKAIIERLKSAYKSNFITADLFSLRSPPLVFNVNDAFGNDENSKRSSGYFGSVDGDRKIQKDKLHM